MILRPDPALRDAATSVLGDDAAKRYERAFCSQAVSTALMDLAGRSESAGFDLLVSAE